MPQQSPTNTYTPNVNALHTHTTQITHTQITHTHIESRTDTQTDPLWAHDCEAYIRPEFNCKMNGPKQNKQTTNLDCSICGISLGTTRLTWRQRHTSPKSLWFLHRQGSANMPNTSGGLWMVLAGRGRRGWGVSLSVEQKTHKHFCLPWAFAIGSEDLLPRSRTELGFCQAVQAVILGGR